ncbi:YihY family inner membrane protein [Salinadaptatus halalkaliphilus]|uniref:YihY family inner membrane protein n=1 Tax=Salinadaptatus halalkaliphilus TaxID=2419781 RepID=A0A4S3TND0_9EURY|nr:YhjD/YihY/BrkB family envelope integrity protein [Salinadaptatus halalkaliphilus]THE65686.1 YihY family inner membrane protein [Salinadaptatus halalkaliphilus]
MATDVHNGIAFGRTVVAGVQEKNVPFMAASIAYQAFISLIPLLVLVFFLVTLVGDEGLATEVSAMTEGFLPESGQLLVENAIAESPVTAGSTLIGLVVVLWGSLKIFRGLDTAFSEIFDSADEASIVEQLRDALIVLGAIGAALVAAAVASIAVAVLPNVPYLGLLNPVILVVVLTLAFLPMYYYFPDVDLQLRQVVPGAVVAGVGWTALQSLFQVYVTFAADSEAAGPVGAVLLLLTWLYFGGMLLLVGGVVNAVGTGYLEPEIDGSDDGGEAAIAEAGHTPLLDRVQRERDQLLERAETVERERDLLQNDLAAQRSRRYRLEDRVDRLEAEKSDLEAENERLRATLERRRWPPWRRGARGLLARVRRVRIGRLERE